MNILLIDDDPVDLAFLEALLSTSTNTIHKAQNGLIALDILARESIDWCILDIMMPVMNGYQFLQELKSRGVTVPIYVLTGASTKNVCRRTNAIGYKYIQNFLYKPLCIDKLKNIVTYMTWRKYSCVNSMITN